jgi:hypothetical protein
MPKNAYSIEIAAPCNAVFDVIHDYTRRLEWDSMLSEARLLGGATRAGLGVRSLCVGTWQSAFQGLETEYIRFDPGRAAAVKLTGRSLLFRRFAATIKHDAVDPESSRTTYIYSFRARPAWLAPVLEPLIKILLDRELRRRLRSLRAYLERASPLR